MFKWLYNLSWTLQVLVGLNLFGVTAVLETSVLSAYLDSFWLGVSIAAGLEAAKVLTIVLYRVLKAQTEVDYPFVARTAALTFRIMLFALSAACSVMFLARHLDRPAMEQVRRADLAAAEARYREDLSAARNEYSRQREDLLRAAAQRAKRDREALAQRYLPAISQLESRLDQEMNNVVGGEFKGKRYRELQARLAEEKDGYARALAAFEKTGERLPSNPLEHIDAEWRSRQQSLVAQRASTLSRIRDADYQGDARVENSMARAFVGVLSAVLDRRPSTLQFVFCFALFLSLTMELGIWIAFEHLTLACLPMVSAGFREQLHTQRRVIETDSELRDLQMEDELVRAKVRRKRQAIEETLRPSDPDKLFEQQTG